MRQLCASVATFCGDAADELAKADRALDDESMAWLVLCERGWPNDVRADASFLHLTRQWMALWSEYVTLPVEIRDAVDRVRESRLQDALTECEGTFVSALPPAVRQLVEPLDATGRATLACVLQSLASCVEARNHALSAAQRTTALRERAQRLESEAQALDLTPPADPLDVEQWRSILRAASDSHTGS